MKFKKPTQKSAVDKVVQALSLGTGVVLSKGAMSMLPENYQTPLYKGGMALVSLLVAAIIKGETTFDKSVQSAFVGMGVEQGVQALSTELGKQINVDPNATGGQKFLQASLGLNGGVSQDTTQQLLPRNAFNARSNDQPAFNPINAVDMSA